MTSKRLLATGIGIAVTGIPFSLWFVVVGPTAGDRLVAVGFLVACAGLSLYSLWEARAGAPSRPDPEGGRT